MPPPLNAAARFGIGYRAMADADLPFVEALYASTRAEELALTGWPPEQQRAFLVQQHRMQHRQYRACHPDAEWLIVERRGEPIGRLYLKLWEGRRRIIDISLVPAARGLGIGGAILADVIAAAESQGQGVALRVEMRNPARRLYERLGFELVEDQGAYLCMERPARGQDLSRRSPRSESPAASAPMAR
jgi:GNAT superfamily N-acetyltransferase